MRSFFHDVVCGGVLVTRYTQNRPFVTFRVEPLANNKPAETLTASDISMFRLFAAAQSQRQVLKALGPPSHYDVLATMAAILGGEGIEVDWVNIKGLFFLVQIGDAIVGAAAGKCHAVCWDPKDSHGWGPAFSSVLADGDTAGDPDLLRRHLPVIQAWSESPGIFYPIKLAAQCLMRWFGLRLIWVGACVCK